MVDILNGAACLFEQVPTSDNRYWKEQKEIQEYSEALKKGIAIIWIKTMRQEI